MATAGMRLLTKKQNNDIWKTICKTEFNGYQFASIKSKKCGTIPGTQEAFYEWLANIAENSEIKNRDQSFEQITGTFTVGGASAQIAVPLLSTKMVESWEEMIERIETRFGNCKDIMLPGGEHPIPIFSDVVNGVSCARDFIDIKMTEEIKDSLREDVQEYTNLSEMKGLGLVSFLGLSGQGGDIESGVAGGAEKITTWAEHVSCDPTESSGSTAKYEICKNRLKVALNTDPLFAEVKEFFHEHNLNVKHFNFNTPGATPSGAFNKEHADGLMKLKISIPLTVGGGLRTIEDIRLILNNGADKVAINTEAVSNPDFIKKCVNYFGSSTIVLSINYKSWPNDNFKKGKNLTVGSSKEKDTKKWNSYFQVYTENGRQQTGLDAFEWAQMGEKMGVGEILLTSIDNEGMKKGFEIDLTERLSKKLSVPFIVCGGLGKKEDAKIIYEKTKCNAISFASVLHYNKLSIAEIKKYLSEEKIEIINHE